MATHGTGVSLMAMSSVRIDPQAVAAMFRSPSGPVGLELFRRAGRVQERAKVYVGYSTDKPSGSQGGQHLRDTIVKRFVTTAEGIAVTVGSDSPIARMHHDGTEPHDIYPVNARVLVFKVAGGGLVFTTHVSHPGTKPNPFLQKAAEDEGLKFQRLA